MIPVNFLNIFSLLCFFLLPAISNASSYGPFKLIEHAPVSEIWLNPGFLSYHFQKDIDLDDNNIGFGAEYRYSTIHSLTAGRFHNSDKQISNYAAWYWQPLEYASIRIGALIGAINGYPKAYEGGWFPLLLPVVSFEQNNLGINLTVVPSYKDMLHGSISLQLKLKVH